MCPKVEIFVKYSEDAHGNPIERLDIMELSEDPKLIDAKDLIGRTIKDITIDYDGDLIVTLEEKGQ